MLVGVFLLIMSPIDVFIDVIELFAFCTLPGPFVKKSNILVNCNSRV